MDDTTDDSYGSEGAYGVYQDDTAAQTDLYDASTQAEVAGDSYGAYQLNEESIEAGGDASTAYGDYNTPAVEPETLPYSDGLAGGAESLPYSAGLAGGADSLPYSGGGEDFNQQYADYIGS